MNLELVNDIQQQDKNAIKQLRQRKQITIRLLASILGIDDTKARRILKRLCSKGYCYEVRVNNRIYYKDGSAPTVADATLNTPPVKFTGIRWEPSQNRRGCQDFLQCPSRIGDRLVPHRPMMHGCT